ncbi:MAG: LPP20 family lipoprotein [Candidatus Cloacimonadales bacterium]
MKRIGLIIIAITIFSCAVVSEAEAKRGKNEKPKWVDNPASAYPEAYYLSAIGEGDTRSYAENMAAANISRIFESQVKADQSVSNRYSEIADATGVSSSETTDIATNVNISSDQTLLNLKFGESYTDELGTVYVIAYIDRMKTATIYENRIAEANAKIVEFIKQGENIKSRTHSYAYLSAAKLFHDQLDVMLQQLDIISANSRSMIELDYDANALQKKLNQVAEEVTFSIDLTNDEAGKIESVLQQLLTSMGFRLSDNGLLKVQGSVDFSETDLGRDDYVFVRYDLQLKIIDDRGNIVAALSEKGREGQNSFAEAKARCVLKLQNKIEKNLQRKVVQFFDNLVK